MYVFSLATAVRNWAAMTKLLLLLRICRICILFNDAVSNSIYIASNYILSTS